jgi:NADP-dependent 3-hydroxy acid dehydrogenase YdfG
MAKTNKVALITGCSEPQSLGAALATELNRRGYRVFATARNIHTMDHLRALGCDVLQLDVTNHDSIAEAAQTVAAEAGRLDLLDNNVSKKRFELEVRCVGGAETTSRQACTPSRPRSTPT